MKTKNKTAKPRLISADKTKELVQRAKEKAFEEGKKAAAATALPPGMATIKNGEIIVGETRNPYNAYTDQPLAVGAGLILRAFAASDGNWEQTKSTLASWHKSFETPDSARIQKALAENDFDNAGGLIQTMYSSEIIELLRNETVIRKAGARVIPMPGGNLSISKIVGGSTAYYRGEGQSITPSTLTVSQMQLSSKELVGLVPISNRLLKHANPAVDVIVRDDLVATLGVKEDATFLRSVGSQSTPKGLRYLVNASSVSAPAGATVANVRSALGNAILGLKNANIQMRKLAWFIAPRTEEFLMQLAEPTTQHPIFEQEMIERGTIRGIQYFSTNQIPIDLNTGVGSESEIYLVDMAEVFIGEDGVLETSIEKNVTYVDAAGNLRSAFATGETVVRALQMHDFGVRYDKAIYVLNQVTWAP